MDKYVKKIDLEECNGKIRIFLIKIFESDDFAL